MIRSAYHQRRWPQNGFVAALCALLFFLASARGAGIQFATRQIEGQARLEIVSPYYVAVLAPAQGAQITSLRRRGRTRNLGAFFGDFDARIGPPGFASSTYTYAIVDTRPNRLAVKCTRTQGPGGHVAAGQVWAKTFIFRADTPAIRVLVELSVKGEDTHAAYGARARLNVGGPHDADAFFLALDGDKTETIEMAEAMAERATWAQPQGACAFAAADRQSGEGVMIRVLRPTPRYTRLSVDAAGRQTAIDFSFPISAISKARPYRIAMDLMPLGGVKSPEQLSKRLPRLVNPEPLAPEPAPPAPAPLKAPRTGAALRRVLMVSPPERRGLYGIRPPLDALPFPTQITDVACVRGTYWPGENEFLKGLPASDAQWAQYALAVFIDVPGWAFGQGDGERVKRFVAAGGNVIFVGDQGRGYRKTAVGELIPLKIPYAERAERDDEGRQFLRDRSAWTPIAIPGFKHPALRGLPRNALPTTVVHQAAPEGSSEVLVAAASFPVLAVKQNGKGWVVSMPIALSTEPETDGAAPAVLTTPSRELDGTLTRWPFYDDMWRQLLIWLCAKPSAVFLSGFIVPEERTLSVPSSFLIEYELSSQAKAKTAVHVHIDFWRDGHKIDALHSEARFELPPGQSVGRQAKVDLPPGRGRYRYAIAIQDKEKHTIDWRDGEFMALPETYMSVDLGDIRVFAQDAELQVQTLVNNIKAPSLRVAALVRDAQGRTAIQLPPRDLQDLSLAKIAITSKLDLTRLRPGPYTFEARLLGGPKLDQALDTVVEPFSVRVRAPAQPFVVALGGLRPGAGADAARQVQAALDLGFNAAVLPEVRLQSPRFASVAGAGALAFIHQAGQRGLSLIAGPPSMADLLRRHCVSALALPQLPEHDKQALHEYLLARRQAAVYSAWALAPGAAPIRHKPCDTCKKIFRSRYGYDMPTRDDARRYYYARKFMSDTLAACLARVRSEIATQHAPRPCVALIDPAAYFTGACDPAQFARPFDVVAPTSSGSPLVGRLFQEATRSALSPGKQRWWATIHVCPRAGEPWQPSSVATQAYEAIGRGATGLYVDGLQHGPHAATDSAEGLREARRTFAEARMLGPMLAALRRPASEVALLYPWASFAFSDPQPIVRVLSQVHDMLEAVVGPVDVVHEGSILDASRLAGLKVLVIAESRCIPDRLAQAIEHWVTKGGILVTIGAVGVIDERQLPSRFTDKLLGLRYGPKVEAAVQGLSPRVHAGIVLAPRRANVMHKYAGAGAAIVVNDVADSGAVSIGFLPTPDEFRRIMDEWLPKPSTARASDPAVHVFTLVAPKGAATYLVAVNTSSTFRDTQIVLPPGVPHAAAYSLLDGAPTQALAGPKATTLPIKLGAGRASVLGLFAGKPAKIEFSLTRAKGVVDYTLKVLTASGKPFLAPLPVEIMFIAPDGAVRKEHGGWRATQDGALAGREILPYDAPKGKWTVLARIRVGDLSAKQEFAVD